MSHKLRRGQAVVPFGVGAIVDFRREALMAAGLESWPDEPDGKIEDPRLARRLGIGHFREPPAAEDGRSPAALPFVRFPLWHVCPRCRSLVAARWNDPKPPRCESPIPPGQKLKKAQASAEAEQAADEVRARPDPIESKTRNGQGKSTPCSALPERRRMRMVPLRFVMACPSGHIEDFPWIEWVHTKEGPLMPTAGCDNPQLRLLSMGLAGLEGLLLMCHSCESAKSLALAGGPGALKALGCNGSRPWLGPAGNDTTPCPHNSMRVLQRGATNIYFANVASSILIPPYTSHARRILEDPATWRHLAGKTATQLADSIESIAVVKKIAVADLRRAYDEKAAEPARADVGEQSDEDFRYAEYAALLDPTRAEQDDLRIVRRERQDYDPWLRDFITDVVLVEKLAETRALTGFSRDRPDLAIDAWTPKLDQLSLDPTQRWLPAIRVYGEGLLLTLDQDRLARWADVNGGRVLDLAKRYRDVAVERGREVSLLPPSFFVLHTLAHVVIRRLSFECGYGSSSLRERIYCRAGGPKPSMAGLLIYTAAGDSEGTMGGLVRQGRPGRLEAVVRAALDEAKWCASDPLCMESHGQGTNSLNLAACHACALLPETSCETGNRLLDRSCLVGNPNEPQLGLFGE